MTSCIKTSTVTQYDAPKTAETKSNNVWLVLGILGIAAYFTFKS